MQTHPVINVTPAIITLCEADVYSLCPQRGLLFIPRGSLLFIMLREASAYYVPWWILVFHASRGGCLLVMLRKEDAYFSCPLIGPLYSLIFYKADPDNLYFF